MYTVIRYFIHKRRYFIGYDTVKNHGEVLLSPLHLLVIVDKESTVNILHKTIERFATTCNFFRDWKCICEIIASCGTFPITNLLFAS